MRLVAHRVDAASVDPTVIEVKQGTHGYGVVNGLVREARFVKDGYIGRVDGHRVFIDLADEAEKSLVRIAKP